MTKWQKFCMVMNEDMEKKHPNLTFTLTIFFIIIAPLILVYLSMLILADSLKMT